MRVASAIGAIVLLEVLLASTAAAQGRPAPAVDLAAGWVGFADDGIVSEGMVGAAARLYLLPRISVGPEVVYINGQNHSHLVVTGNMTFDVLSPVNGRPRSVNPFVVVGGGVFQTRQQFLVGRFTSSEGAFTVGGGVRALVGDRVTVGIEVRMGWEPHVRVNGLVGVQLGR